MYTKSLARRRRFTVLSVLCGSLIGWTMPGMADVAQLEPVQAITLPRFCNPLCPTSDSALDGDTAMLPGADNSVAVYQRDRGGEWTLRQTLHSPSMAEGLSEVFGKSMSLSGDLAILTGDFYDAEGNQASSRVYVFQRVRDSWRFTQRVTLPFQNAPEVQFVLWEVELDGRNALISTQVFTPLPDSPGGSSSRRHVYAFRWENGRLQRKSEVLPSDAPVGTNAAFGLRIKLNSNTAFITGAPQSGSPGPVVSTFERIGHEWRQRQVLRPDPADADFFFGLTLSIQGDRAAISSPFVTQSIWHQGTVFVYRRHRGLWRLEQRLINPAAAEFPTPGDLIRFGIAQSISRHHLVIENTASPLFHSARLFNRDNRSREWQEAARLGQPGDRVYDVHVQGSTALLMKREINSVRASFYRLPRFAGTEAEADEAAADSIEDVP